MGKPIGGTCYFKVDGNQLELSGGVTVDVDENEREGVAPGWFTEKDNIPSIEGEFFIPKDFPIDTITTNTSMTITAELKSGRVAVLSEAYRTGKLEVDGEKGTAKIKFEGKSGKWM